MELRENAQPPMADAFSGFNKDDFHFDKHAKIRELKLTIKSYTTFRRLHVIIVKYEEIYIGGIISRILNAYISFNSSINCPKGQNLPVTKKP